MLSLKHGGPAAIFLGAELGRCFVGSLSVKSFFFYPRPSQSRIPPPPPSVPGVPETRATLSLSPKSKTSGLSGDCRGGNLGSHPLPGQSLNQSLPFFLALTTLTSSASCDASCYPLSRLLGSRVDRPDPWQWILPHPHRALGPGFLFSILPSHILAYLLSILPAHISAYSWGKRR